ncbi:purine nucleoside permease [Aspergillus californicus]
MRFSSLLSGLLLTCTAASMPSGSETAAAHHQKISPQVFIISMFTPEAEIWHGIPEFNLLAHNITLPGLSPLFPSIHCSRDYKVCQIVTGEGEINAAVTLSSLVFSDRFNLTSTYFLIAGIAGISPEVGTIAGVTFARFAVQVALQYEFDAREIPMNMSTGYIPQGATAPGQYPTSIYGTEVFEVNENLRDIAAAFAKNATLADTDVAKEYRALYAADGEIYSAGTKAPSVINCDTSTSDVYFSGRLLGEAFSNTTSVLTSGQGLYCSTQQEDNASLEALLRGATASLVDFGRIIIMRTASDFDRPHSNQDAMDNLLYAEQGAFEPAVENLYRAGIEVVMGILGGWESGFKQGIEAQNYLGDILGTFGERADFVPAQTVVKRGFGGRAGRRSRR